MQLLLKCAGGGVHGQCQYALVNLNDELKRVVLARRALFQAARLQDSLLWSLIFWDTFAVFYDVLEPEDSDEEVERRPVLHQAQQAELERVDYLILENDFKPAIEPVRVECAWLVVEDSSFYWRARMKHRDVLTATAGLAYALLQNKGVS